MELDELIRTVQKIDILDKSLYKQKRSGLFNSSLRGHGITFDTIRKYEVGDDVRDINWNATARFREPYINTFTEDKERLVWIVVDISGSSAFGTRNKSKLDLEIEIGATLAFSAIKKNDSVGVIFFSDKIEKVLMPNKGMQVFWHIANVMIKINPSGKGTDINVALHFLSTMVKSKSLIFLVSDFLTANYKPGLTILEQTHKLIGIRVYDETEENFPELGWLRFKDSESGKNILLNTRSANFQQDFGDQFKNSRIYFEQSFYNPQQTLSISTNDNVVEKLMDLMHSSKYEPV